MALIFHPWIPISDKKLLEPLPSNTVPPLKIMSKDKKNTPFLHFLLPGSKKGP
jgi:hypothetical protein